jgi:hypothetical protein
MQAFSVLNTRERHVLEMRIFLDATPAQVAASIGVSSGNVRVIQSRALSKIRKHLESLRNESASRTMATVVTLFDAIRYLRDELPSEGLIGQWIDGVRDASAKAAGASAAISGGVAASSAAGAGAGSAAASVASTSVVASAAVKLTMIITLTVASTIGAGVIATGSESVVANGGVVSDEVEVSRDQQDPEMGSPESVTPGSEEPVETAPGSSTNSRTISPVGTAIGTESDRVVPFAPEVVEPDAGLVEDLVHSVSEDVLDPLADAVVDDVVDPIVGAVVNDVVDPLLGVVVGVVDPLLEDVVDPIVGTVVDDVVDPLVDPVDDLVDPVIEDVLDPLLDGLVEELELPPVLGGLLGG